MTWFVRCVALGVALCIGERASAQQRPPALTAAVLGAVVDSVRRAMLTYYVFPDSAKAMTAGLARRRTAGGFDTLTSPAALAAELTREMRRVHNDTHLRIEYDPEEAARAADTTRREARDMSVRDRKANFYFRDARILPGNVGYIEFSQYADTNEVARRTVRAVMQFVAHTDALIIDLRDNRGGSAAMAGEITSYFVNSRVHWSNSYNRLTDTWTEGWVENRPEITGGIYLGMPITVLTSSWTFSAAEGLAYALQHGRNARVVGQRTGGGAHVVRRVGLGNGFVGFIPYIRGVSVATGTNWEGTGVIPNLVVDAPLALVKAQEAILGDRMATAKDSSAQRAISWAVNEARASAATVDVPATVLRSYTGRFEEYLFSVRDNRLYSENRSRNGKLDRLIPITMTLFQLDRESQVEFVRDPSGAISNVRIHWNDGWIDTIKRALPP